MNNKNSEGKLCAVDKMSLSKFVQGAKFRTYKEIEPLLVEHAKKQHVLYGIYCSQLVESYNAKFNKCLPKDLKYQSFTYACNHYGNPRKNSKGMRPNQRYFPLKKRCKAHVRVSTDETTIRLEVSKIITIHNHELDPVLAPCYPENRRLDQSEARHALPPNATSTPSSSSSTYVVEDVRHIWRSLSDVDDVGDLWLDGWKPRLVVLRLCLAVVDAETVCVGFSIHFSAPRYVTLKGLSESLSDQCVTLLRSHRFSQSQRMTPEGLADPFLVSRVTLIGLVRL
ncbi:Zinc finger SWIM domain-containing protein 3 [Frankliniella fusca]|uniref:Zinc finger SWIM domain-containing protein 3 n=1 Tax=Frankliniella fusca TaxID=407009 RepID=A0AAE1LHL9_9NEOP|nr:Zinc finger SWIM domain-containing protein 3 [Frankliniella fusca]